MIKEIARTYRRVNMTVKKMINAWVAISTKKLTSLIKGSVSIYTNRSEVVLNYGIFTSEGAIVSIIPPICIANRTEYCIPSLVEEVAVITEVSEQSLINPVGNDVLAAEYDIEAVLNTL